MVGEKRRSRDGTWRATWSLALLMLATAGCGTESIDATYGRRRGASGGDSVNGTRVLAEMFESYGHKVSTRNYLSPKMSEFDVAVWFPDDFGLPTAEQQEFLEEWVSDEPGRTLVYVGRDYDAAVDYWETVLSTTPPQQVAEVLRRQARAKARYDHARTEMPAEGECRWFAVRGNAPDRAIGRDGDREPRVGGLWTRGNAINPSQLNIRLRGRLLPPTKLPKGRYGSRFRTQTLLAAGEDPLVWEVVDARWKKGKILVVANGSFLVNLGLVEHEHRKLAGKLITSCGEPQRRVAFLESGAGGPEVFDQEPGEDYPTGFEAFVIWPIGPILMHFIVLGLVYLASRMSIFGRPSELAPEAISDFGHHIDALGELLARSQNYRYAEQRLEDYRERVRRDHGASPATDRSADPVG
jgi:hypothetical protein